MRHIIALLLFTSSAFAQTISGIEPSSGPTSGGTFVHIIGSDLLGLPLACPALQCANYVQFGDTLGSISVNTSTEIVAVAPPHAAGAVDLIVNIAGKKMITIPSAFIYEATDTTTLERVLLPIVLDGPRAIPGAFGSKWIASATFHNAIDEEVPIQAPNCDPIVADKCFGFVPLVKARATVTPNLFAPSIVGGAFIFVPRQHIHDVDISLRIQDVSRQAQTWGTSVPIVHPTDFRRVARLIGIPTDPRFRLTLRIYGYAEAADPVKVQVYDPNSTKPFVDVQFNLLSGNGYAPAYLQLDPLSYSKIAPLAPPPLVRIEVSSASDPPRPIWAFVTATNNETQHVTVIAPSP